MSEKRKLFKNTIIIAIGKLSTQALTFILFPLYTAYLSTAEYGTYDYVITISIFVFPIVTLMIEESMFRFLIDKEKESERKKIINQASTYILLSTIIFSTLAVIIFEVIDYSNYIYIVLFFISSILILLTNAIARGLGKIKEYSISNIIIGIITLILNVVLIVIFNNGIESLYLSTIIANVIAITYIVIKLRIYKIINIKKFEKKIMKEMIKYSYPLIPNSISFSIISISDRIIIMNMLGASENRNICHSNEVPLYSKCYFWLFLCSLERSCFYNGKGYY